MIFSENKIVHKIVREHYPENAIPYGKL